MVASGKDLSSVRTDRERRGSHGFPKENTLRDFGLGPGRELTPRSRGTVDTRYIMASCDVLSREYRRKQPEIC
jgi:hypothetical protein